MGAWLPYAIVGHRKEGREECEKAPFYIQDKSKVIFCVRKCQHQRFCRARSPVGRSSPHLVFSSPFSLWTSLSIAGPRPVGSRSSRSLFSPRPRRPLSSLHVPLQPRHTIPQRHHHPDNHHHRHHRSRHQHSRPYRRYPCRRPFTPVADGGQFIHLVQGKGKVTGVGSAVSHRNTFPRWSCTFLL
jgi:hypothetical protein